MYRLNCHLPEVYKERLNEYSKRNNITITAMVQVALDQYFQVEDVKTAFIEKMKDDPTVLQQMFGAMKIGQPEARP